MESDKLELHKIGSSQLEVTKWYFDKKYEVEKAIEQGVIQGAWATVYGGNGMFLIKVHHELLMEDEWVVRPIERGILRDELDVGYEWHRKLINARETVLDSYGSEFLKPVEVPEEETVDATS